MGLVVLCVFLGGIGTTRLWDVWQQQQQTLAQVPQIIAAVNALLAHSPAAVEELRQQLVASGAAAPAPPPPPVEEKTPDALPDNP